MENLEKKIKQFELAANRYARRKEEFRNKEADSKRRVDYVNIKHFGRKKGNRNVQVNR